MKKRRIAIVAGVVLALCAGMAAVMGGTSQGRHALVTVREAVFSRTVDDLSLWEMSPSQLAARGYKTDTLDVPHREEDIKSATAAVRHMIMVMPPHDAREAQCGAFPDLAAARQALLNEGRSACCSDYVEVFVSEAQKRGWFARELRVRGHVVADVYDPVSESWVYVDPLFGLIAMKNGAAADFADVQQDIMTRDGHVVFLDVRNGVSFTVNDLPDAVAAFYTQDAFSAPSLPLGNNVYAEDAFSKKIKFMPKALRQVFAYAAGVKPLTAKAPVWTPGQGLTEP